METMTPLMAIGGGLLIGTAAALLLLLTGRIADPSLFLGCAMHHYGWAYDDWPMLAAGTAGALAWRTARTGASVVGAPLLGTLATVLTGLAAALFTVHTRWSRPAAFMEVVDLRPAALRLCHQLHGSADARQRGGPHH